MDDEQSWVQRSAPTIAVTFLVLVAHLWLTTKVVGPTVVFDENGYLGNARALVGGSYGRWEMPYAPFYSGGYSVLLTPLVAIWREPDAQWRAIQVANAVLLCALVPLLAAVGRHVLGLPRRRALVVAAVGAIVPAALAVSSSAVAENLVLPLVAATVLAAWAMTGTGGVRLGRLWLGPLAGLLYAAHPRFSLTLVLTVGLLVWWGVRHRTARTVTALNGVGLVAVVAATLAVNRHLRAVRWVAGVERLEGDTTTWFDLFTSGSGLRELALTAVGQAWYLAVGSLGLAVVGVLAAGRAASSGQAVASEAGWPAPSLAERRRTVLAYLLVAAAAVFATSVLFFAQNQFRADHYVYGRHNDSFSPLWVVLGLALVLDVGRRRAALRSLAAAAGAVAVLGVVLATFRSPSDLFEIFSPFAVPALARFADSRPSDVFIEGTLFGLGGALLIAAITWMADRPATSARLRLGLRTTIVVGVAAWCGWAGYGVVQGTATFARGLYDFWSPTPTIERLEVDELCIDASAARARGNLSYPWYLPEVDVRTYNGAIGEVPTCSAAIARLDDQARAAAGDRIAVTDQGGYYPFWEAPEGLALWIAPGPEEDRLDAQGALLPQGFPGPLPPAARRAELALVDPPTGPVEVAPGGRVRVPVSVTHAGAGSPWPDIVNFAAAERVRVQARITPLDPDGVEGARSGGELLTWMLPGDRTIVDAEVIAVDQFLAPLPPGRYDVQLGVGQEDGTWFAPGGEAARFELVVPPAG